MASKQVELLLIFFAQAGFDFQTRVTSAPAGRAWLCPQKKTTSTFSPSSHFFTSMGSAMLEFVTEANKCDFVNVNSDRDPSSTQL